MNTMKILNYERLKLFTRNNNLYQMKRFPYCFLC